MNVEISRTTDVLNTAETTKTNVVSNMASNIADKFVTTIKLLEGERWWGGTVIDGIYEPFGKQLFTRDLSEWTQKLREVPEASNQSSPLLISTCGRYVWCKEPFKFTFEDRTLSIKHSSSLIFNKVGDKLSDAYKYACNKYFPPSDRSIPADLIDKPQYNTWIEMPYAPTQDKVENYARQILESGMPSGIIMIDDKWSPDYGDWTFDISRFPKPRKMIDSLHEQGFCVMLWLVPFISPDSENFRYLEKENLLLRNVNGETAIRRWWNGLSAVLDLSHPKAISWLEEKLDALRQIGVDGFKFDGGDFYECHNDDISYESMTSAEFCERWAKFGLRYSYNEFRACWKMGGQPLAQRLRDKPQSWGVEGLQSLIPEIIAQGLIGHAFTCPDMIGGGEIESMQNANSIDQDFFIRYAQIAALCPMMQFSTLPHRVLDKEHMKALICAIRTREAYLPTIQKFALNAANTGEPIVRPMSYHYDHCEDIIDQFLLGDRIIVAPALNKYQKQRSVYIPDGSWESDDKIIFNGPTTIIVDTPLDRIPIFTKKM